MKAIIILALVPFIIASHVDNHSQAWAQFKIDYGKTYKSLVEEKFRYAIFKARFDSIQVHNTRYEKGEVSYFLKINSFSDLSDEEFERIYLTYQQNTEEAESTFELPESAVVPDSIDWRSKGAVLPVQNQGYCGSCYAFSALGALEGQNFIKHNVLIGLSEQEIIDCSKENDGCNGGNMTFVYDYIRNNGISTYSSYPYGTTDKKCKNGTTSGIKITGYVEVPRNEESLKQAVGTIGPISVGVNAQNFRDYGGGIFNWPPCRLELHHAVLAVGYGNENGTDYWLIKNSWGKQWGEEGYIRMSRNKNQQCGISRDNLYPVVV